MEAEEEGTKGGDKMIMKGCSNIMPRRHNCPGMYFVKNDGVRIRFEVGLYV